MTAPGPSTTWARLQVRSTHRGEAAADGAHRYAAMARRTAQQDQTDFDSSQSADRTAHPPCRCAPASATSCRMKGPGRGRMIPAYRGHRAVPPQTYRTKRTDVPLRRRKPGCHAGLLLVQSGLHAPRTGKLTPPPRAGATPIATSPRATPLA
jgi:hypothetical protein